MSQGVSAFFKGPIFKKISGTMVTLILLGVAYLLIVEPMLEKREAAKVMAFLDSLPGELKADRINVNKLENRITINHLTGTLKTPDGQVLNVNVSEIIATGINENALASAAGGELMQECLISSLRIESQATIPALSADSVHREIAIERLFLHKLHGKGLVLPAGGEDKAAQAVYDFLAALTASDMEVDMFSDAAKGPHGMVKVASMTAVFKDEAKDAKPMQLGTALRFTLPNVIGGAIGSAEDKTAIAKGMKEYGDGEGNMNIVLKIAGPLPLAKFAEGMDTPLNAKVGFIK
jgi:hypothetical protein